MLLTASAYLLNTPPMSNHTHACTPTCECIYWLAPVQHGPKSPTIDVHFMYPRLYKNARMHSMACNSLAWAHDIQSCNAGTYLPTTTPATRLGRRRLCKRQAAVKQFRRTKSPATLSREYNFLTRAAAVGAAPAPLSLDTANRRFFMQVNTCTHACTSHVTHTHSISFVCAWNFLTCSVNIVLCAATAAPDGVD